MKISAILSAFFVVTAVGRTGWAQTTQPVEKPADAVVLFDGTQQSLDSNWVFRNGKPAGWVVKDGAMSSVKSDIKTKQKYQDFKLHVEWNEPQMADSVKGQARGNSGVFLQGRYEIQVLDSFGLDAKKDDCGAIYNQVAPLVNACLPPGQWQTYDIDYHAAKFAADGKKTAEARVTVYQNGKLIQDNVGIHHPTGSELSEESAEPGPVLLQFHHNSVQFRNVWIVAGK
jgi:hypothetical protein